MPELPVSIWLLETAMALELVLILKPVVQFWITFSSRPPKCVALVVVDEQFLPTRKARVNTGLGVSTPREIPVPTIVSTIWELDVLEPSMTLTLQRVRCGVDVVVVIHYAVQPQITTSSMQQTTLAPPISLQMTATDNSTHRISQLKNFAVVVEEVFNGLPMRSRIVRQHSNVLTYPPTAPMYRPVLNTIKTHRHAECTYCGFKSLPVAHFSYQTLT